MSIVQKLPQRPICVNCGARYGIRHREQDKLRPEANGAITLIRGKWDGVSWYTKYEPFCTLRCALNYARKAFLKK